MRINSLRKVALSVSTGALSLRPIKMSHKDKASGIAFSCGRCDA